MTPNLDPQAPMQQGNWFSRNWKWLLPVGCMVPLVCCGGIGGVAYFAASTMIKGSGAFTQAFAKASDNAEVKEALGAPLTPGFGMSGSMKETNGNGNADFSVPIQGPKGSGSLHVVGRSRSGVWKFERIDVEAGGKTIDVLSAGGADELPPPDDGESPPDEPEGD